jgi:hypothetical protein
VTTVAKTKPEIINARDEVRKLCERLVLVLNPDPDIAPECREDKVPKGESLFGALELVLEKMNDREMRTAILATVPHDARGRLVCSSPQMVAYNAIDDATDIVAAVSAQIVHARVVLEIAVQVLSSAMQNFGDDK